MATIHPYLNFSGNCRRAMKFYQRCLGGVLTLTTLGDTPHADQFPASLRQLIVEARLKSSDIKLLGTDLVGSEELVAGNTTSLLIEFEEEPRAVDAFRCLCEKSEQMTPMERTPSGSLIGQVTDQFGNQWIIQS